GAFVVYSYENPQTKKIEPKMVYAKYFKDWDWIIVSNIYIQEVENNVISQKEKIDADIKYLVLELLIFGVIMVLIIFGVIYFMLGCIVNRPLDLLAGKAADLEERVTLHVN
ncbi:MAG: cache domain-containing protein, partial [Campylobacteraceae bacterium]|nr:cache domain-containing protein [Campylobacteraceae bacterium]